jgi:hypothetical protein
MPKFWSLVEHSSYGSPAQQVQAFREVFIVQDTNLFGERGLGFRSDAGLDAAILRSTADARTHPSTIRSAEELLENMLPSELKRFKTAFPDFRCDFPIYIMPSLGQLDGARRVVDRRPALLFGVDVIAEGTPALRILIDHELFHRYHYQVAKFNDDNAEREVMWKTLWAEGQATYVSMVLNTPASMQDALYLPKDLVERAKPMLRQLISELGPKLDQVDPGFFSRYFKYHGANATPPSRDGYYIGALAAQRMGQRYFLFQLAHLHASAVRPSLQKVIAEIK